MAAGERNKNGKPKDIVKHAKSGLDSEIIVCGQKNYGYSTDDWSDVTCLKCIRRRRIGVRNILFISENTTLATLNPLLTKPVNSFKRLDGR